MGLIHNNINWIVSANSILHQCKSQKQLFEKLLFIQTQHMDRPHLALDTVDIYRLKQAPYQSFMRSQRYESPKLTQFSLTLRKLSEVVIHKNLAPVQFIKLNEENNMCMRSVKIDYFATYYGIELRDVIENRKSQDSRFDQGEILYVAKSLISVGAYLQGHSIAFGLYKSKNIFISDNGYIKMYLFHMLQDNKHVNYFNLLSSKPSNSSLHLPIAPQMFHDLQENNLTPSFDFFKADLFEIGMVLIDMMVESSLQRYYRSGKEGIIFEENKLQKDLQELNQKSVYHPKIIHFLENILQTKPQYRWTFQKADKYLDELKKEAQLACRLSLYNEPEEEEESQLKNKISFKSQQPQSQYVLRSIQNTLQSKLNPLPLKSLSKLTSNNIAKDQAEIPKYLPFLNKTNYPSNDTSAYRSIYTRRRNTGVSIISSSSHQNNNRSFSRKDEKSSKFTTVRNSRVAEQKTKIQKSQNQKEEVTDFGQKISCISNNLNQYRDRLENRRQKHSENWLTLGSTRITEENSRTFNFLPPKSSKSMKTNPKIHLHHMSKQNIENISKKQLASSSISTHIKLHKKNIMSPRAKESQLLKGSNVNFKEEWKENLPFNTSAMQSSQKSALTVRPKMKINHHFRA